MQNTYQGFMRNLKALSTRVDFVNYFLLLRMTLNGEMLGSLYAIVAEKFSTLKKYNVFGEYPAKELAILAYSKKNDLLVEYILLKCLSAEDLAFVYWKLDGPLRTRIATSLPMNGKLAIASRATSLRDLAEIVPINPELDNYLLLCQLLEREKNEVVGAALCIDIFAKRQRNYKRLGAGVQWNWIELEPCMKMIFRVQHSIPTPLIAFWAKKAGKSWCVELANNAPNLSDDAISSVFDELASSEGKRVLIFDGIVELLLKCNSTSPVDTFSPSPIFFVKFVQVFSPSEAFLRLDLMQAVLHLTNKDNLIRAIFSDFFVEMKREIEIRFPDNGMTIFEKNTSDASPPLCAEHSVDFYACIDCVVAALNDWKTVLSEEKYFEKICQVLPQVIGHIERSKLSEFFLKHVPLAKKEHFFNFLLKNSLDQGNSNGIYAVLSFVLSSGLQLPPLLFGHLTSGVTDSNMRDLWNLILASDNPPIDPVYAINVFSDNLSLQNLIFELERSKTLSPLFIQHSIEKKDYRQAFDYCTKYIHEEYTKICLTELLKAGNTEIIPFIPKLAIFSQSFLKRRPTILEEYFDLFMEIDSDVLSKVDLPFKCPYFTSKVSNLRNVASVFLSPDLESKICEWFKRLITPSLKSANKMKILLKIIERHSCRILHEPKNLYSLLKVYPELELTYGPCLSPFKTYVFSASKLFDLFFECIELCLTDASRYKDILYEYFYTVLKLAPQIENNAHRFKLSSVDQAYYFDEKIKFLTVALKHKELTVQDFESLKVPPDFLKKLSLTDKSFHSPTLKLKVAFLIGDKSLVPPANQVELSHFTREEIESSFQVLSAVSDDCFIEYLTYLLQANLISWDSVAKSLKGRSKCPSKKEKLVEFWTILSQQPSIDHSEKEVAINLHSYFTLCQSSFPAELKQNQPFLSLIVKLIQISGLKDSIPSFIQNYPAISPEDLKILIEMKHDWQSDKTFIECLIDYLSKDNFIKVFNVYDTDQSARAFYLKNTESREFRNYHPTVLGRRKKLGNLPAK